MALQGEGGHPRQPFSLFSTLPITLFLLCKFLHPSEPEPSKANPSQAKTSQAKTSQVKPSQDKLLTTSDIQLVTSHQPQVKFIVLCCLVALFYSKLSIVKVPQKHKPQTEKWVTHRKIFTAPIHPTYVRQPQSTHIQSPVEGGGFSPHVPNFCAL